MEICVSLSTTAIRRYKKLKIILPMKIVRGYFIFLPATIRYLTYNTDFIKENKKTSIMTSLWIAYNYTFKAKAYRVWGILKWKQISLFLLSLIFCFFLSPISLTMQELGRSLCHRTQPCANAELEALGFSFLSLHPDKFLTPINFVSLLSHIWVTRVWNC